MKIGLVLDDTLDSADGVQQYVLGLGRWYSAGGHEVHYLVGATTRQDIPHIHSLSRNLRVSFNQNRLSTPLPAHRSAIKKLLAAEQFDVLHVQMPYSPFMAGRVVRAAPRHTAVVGTFHIVGYSRLERVATRMLRIWLWRSMRRFDQFTAVSAPAAHFARKSFRIKHASVIPNPINLDQLQAGKRLKKFNDGKINIVFLGRLVERKGCQQLLEALNQLQQAHHFLNVRVLIVGKGPLDAQLRRYVVRHHLGKVVHFTGFVPEANKPDYLASADIAVFPSLGGESFGIVLTEAMGAGAKVVLAGNNVGYASVMGERPDQLFNPTNTAAFVATLKRFITSDAARTRAYKWQQRHVAQYDIEKVGASVLVIYKSAIAKRS
jgi:phosphatidylinositol alpha-mannosyltransferase